MAYEITWQQPNRIIKLVLNGDVSVEELHRMSDDLVAFLEQGQPPVHLISDARKMGKFPLHLPSVKETSERYLRHPSMGLAVVIGNSNPVLNFLSCDGYTHHPRQLPHGCHARRSAGSAAPGGQHIACRTALDY